MSWYASLLTVLDEHFLGIQECLNLLVALRGWKEHWATERVSLEVRADNITALTMVMSLKGSSPAINRIARELALDLGDASFRPDVISHTPGVGCLVYCRHTLSEIRARIKFCTTAATGRRI